MKVPSLKVMSATALLSVVGSVLVQASGSTDDSLERIASYKQWTRVKQQTLTGFILEPSVTGDWFAPVSVGDGPKSQIQIDFTPKKVSDASSKERHESFLGSVYANDPAKKTIAAVSATAFPEGSILVREKPSTTDATKAESLVVMIKREPGFNPTGGDWQFLAVDGAMTKVTVNQKTGACLDCHQSQKNSDFVYPLK